MPKIKTHKGTAKRYKKTGSGKWVRPKAWRGHHLEIKSSRRTRRYAGKAVVSKARFVACERQASAGLGKIKVIGVQAEGTSVYHVKLPLLGTVDVNDVTLAITFRRGTSKTDQIAEVESLWVANHGRWVHVYTPDEYNAYKAGKCP